MGKSSKRSASRKPSSPATNRPVLQAPLGGLPETAEVSTPRRLSAGLAATTAKPYEGFPLTPHPSGRWCKKIRGKLHYFGKIGAAEDVDAYGAAAALAVFNYKWPWLKDGRTPPPIDAGDGCTIKLLCNTFLTNKRAKLDSGELSARSFQDYFRTCEIMIDQLGRDRRVDDLRSDDFLDLRHNLAKTRKAVALGNDVNRIRGVLKFAFDEELIDKPVRFGQSFDRPSKANLRKARRDAGQKMFNVDEVSKILAALDGQPVVVRGRDKPLTLTSHPAIRAMTLLGLNCGFGNTDVATLPLSALDLDGGWVDFPRPKTGIHRRIPLWQETVEALRKAIATRPKAKKPEDSKLVFLTHFGGRWVRVQPTRDSEPDRQKFVAFDPLSQRFRKLLDQLGINSSRTFYTLRHNFETWGGESKDQVAVDAIMGHVDPSMGAQYRETISDARLKAVVDTVHAWLWPG